MRKRVTSSDVARLAGVSRSLVSAYLNGTPGITVSEDNRASIARAIKELNYTVNVQAKSIKTGRSHCVAVYGDVYNALFLQMVEGIQRSSGPAGYHVLLYGSGSNLDSRSGLIQLYRQGRIDGVITLDFPSPLASTWEAEVLENALPYVTVEGIPAGDRLRCVRTDYAQSVRLALDHLWDGAAAGVPPVYLNVRNVGQEMTWGDRDRLDAYVSWMTERGLQPEVLELANGSGPEGDARVASWLGTLERPAAMLSNWSRGAVCAYRAAHALGWTVGSDLFVMAADDTERVNRHLIPPLPCVEVPYSEMGEQAFLLLKRMMEDQDLSGQAAESGPSEGCVTVPCKLITGL